MLRHLRTTIENKILTLTFMGILSLRTTFKANEQRHFIVNNI